MSIFVCMNPCPDVDLKPLFQVGKKRGPDLSKFGPVGMRVLFGSHQNLKRDLEARDLQPGKGDIKVLFRGHIQPSVDLKIKQDGIEERIAELYCSYGFEETLLLLKGSFSLVLLDQSISVEHCVLYVARDLMGLTPLFVCEGPAIKEYTTQAGVSHPILFSSEKIQDSVAFPPGTYSKYHLSHGVNPVWSPVIKHRMFGALPPPVFGESVSTMHYRFLDQIVAAVDSEIDKCTACFLSGGLKSAIIASVLAKRMEKRGETLSTFFVGFVNETRPDLLQSGYLAAEQAASYIGSNHTSILLPMSDYRHALEEVLAHEIPDAQNTAVLFAGAKWVAERTHCRTIFLGSGMNELVGPSGEYDPIDYDKATRESIHRFSELEGRSIDWCFGYHGLETRLPFLNRDLVDAYFRYPLSFRIESREGIETTFSLGKTSPFLDTYLNWDLIRCKPRSPYKSAL